MNKTERVKKWLSETSSYEGDVDASILFKWLKSNRNELSISIDQIYNIEILDGYIYFNIYFPSSSRRSFDQWNFKFNLSIKVCQVRENSKTH